MERLKYVVVIEKAGHNYSAFSPELPGCISTGETVDETLKNMHEALEIYLEEADTLPESKGLQYFLKEGLLDSSKISEEYLLSTLEIPVRAVA